MNSSSPNREFAPWQPRRGFGLRGVVSVETLLTLVPLLLAFLGVVQLALVGLAVVVVEHAATRGARAATVVLDDDPAHYGGAARGSLVEGSADPAPDYGLPTTPGPSDEPSTPGARLSAIRHAAYAPLAVLSPAPERLGPGVTTLRGAFVGSSALRVATGLFVTGPALASVRLTSPASDEHSSAAERPSLTHVEPTAEFTVSIDYLFPCVVPWVRALVCQSGHALLRAERSRSPEIERPRLRQMLLSAGYYFFPIHAEVTALNQGARYHEEPP